MKFVQNLKHLLKKHKVTIKALSEKTGIDSAILYKMSAGKIANPSIQNVLTIASFFGVSSEELWDQDLENQIWESSHISSYAAVPLIRWEDALARTQNRTIDILGKVPSFSDKPRSALAFALAIDSNIYAPKFPKNTIFVIDPEIQPKHEHYVIVFSRIAHKTVLKQILMDDNDIYLKSVTSDALPNTLPVKKSEDDIIIGKVMFAKINL